MNRYRVGGALCLVFALILAIGEGLILVMPGWYFDTPTVMRDMILIPLLGLLGTALWIAGTPFEKRARAFFLLMLPVCILYAIVLFAALFGTSGFWRVSGGFRQYNLKPFETIRLYLKAHKNGSLNWTIIAANLIGNIVLFAPVGLALPYFIQLFRNKLCFLIGLLGGLCAIEYMQHITGRGSMDIDDVILNSIGAIAVFLIFWNKRAQKQWIRVGILKDNTGKAEPD